MRLLLPFSSILAQSQDPCSSAERRAFDFWVGEWTVHDSTGKFLGRNTIEQVENGCALTERWRSVGGYLGRSLNWFSNSDSLWHQSWVDYQGGSLSLSGGLVDSSMVLQSAFAVQANGQQVADRITWSREPFHGAGGPHQVVQQWDRINREGQVVATSFKGYYHPVGGTLWDVDWSPDGKTIATGGDAGIVHVLDSRTLEEIQSLDLFALMGEEAWVQRLTWHPDGGRIAAAVSGGTGSGIWNVNSSTWISFQAEGVDVHSRAIDWMPDGRAVVAGYEKQLSFWHPDGRLDTVLEGLVDKSYVAVDVRESDGALALLSENLLITDVNGKVLLEQPVREKPVLPLAVEWHPSGEKLAVADYGDQDVPFNARVQVLDDRGKLLWKNEETEGPIRNVAWSTDGRRLGVASNQLQILSDAGEVRFKAPAKTLQWGVQWSADTLTLCFTDDIGWITLLSDEGHVVQKRKVNQ
jgi:WD40 repeat protein